MTQKPNVIDPLDAIADEPEFNGSAADNAEMAVALGGRVEIAGHDFPAPSLAVVALLDAIESPFVDDQRQAVGIIDIFRAIYLIGQRETASVPVLRMMRRKAALDAAGAADGTDAHVMLATIRQAVADAEAEFDAAALEYGHALGAFSPVDAARDIGDYLSMATGFTMIPGGGAKKKSVTT